jgi:hypothetical protein
VKSAKHISNFTLGLNLTNRIRIIVLSVSSEGLLLVGQRFGHLLYVYNANCSYVTSIWLPNEIQTPQVVWTQSGNIIYSERDSQKVVTMSRSGYVIRQTDVFRPWYLSVSTDGVIYLIHKQEDVYQSTDEGLTWSHVFIVSGGWRCWHVIKVSTNSNTEVLWTSMWLDSSTTCLRVYTVDNRRADVIV